LRILRTWSLASRPLVFTLIFISLASTSQAQTNERLFENLSFRFVTPGARSVGMGKAFIGLADDATAAVSNPAGLSNLLEQEFSFEFSGTQRTERRTGSLGPGDIQQFATLTFTPTFFSYVLPLGRTSLGFFRNSIQNFHENFEFGPRAVPTRDSSEDGAFGQLSSKADNFGVSGAFVVSGSVSVGGSFNVTTLDLASEARSGTRLNPRNGTNTIDSGTRISGTGGVLFKPGHGLTIGGTYAQGVKFPLETELFGRFLYTVLDPEGTIIRTGETRTVDYVIPDRYGAGVSWHAGRPLTVLFDTSRIRYSQRITDRFLVVDFLDPAARLSPSNFYINDVYETHTGAEYRFYLTNTTMAIRGGMFTDPDHPLRFRSGGNNLAHPANALENFRFNTLPAQTTVGATVGWGMTVKNRVQIDAAGSFSRDAKEFVASMVVRVR